MAGGAAQRHRVAPGGRHRDTRVDTVAGVIAEPTARARQAPPLVVAVPRFELSQIAVSGPSVPHFRRLNRHHTYLMGIQTLQEILHLLHLEFRILRLNTEEKAVLASQREAWHVKYRMVRRGQSAQKNQAEKAGYGRA